MDYGQNTQPDADRNAFFTAGAGTTQENANNVEPENNLDLSNQVVSWDFSNHASERNLRSIGEASIAARESAPSNPYRPSTEQTLSHPELGQIINLEPPQTPPNGTAELHPKLTGQDFFTAGKFSHKGLDLIKSEEFKLSQDGNISDFYQFITDAREESRIAGGA